MNSYRMSPHKLRLSKRTLNAIGSRVTAPFVPMRSEGNGCLGLATTRNRCMTPTRKMKSSCSARVSPRHTRFPTLNGMKLCIRRASASRSSSLETAVGKLASGLKWSASGHTFGSCRMAYRFPNTIVPIGKLKPSIFTGLLTTCGGKGIIVPNRSASLITDSVYGIFAFIS